MAARLLFKALQRPCADQTFLCDSPPNIPQSISGMATENTTNDATTPVTMATTTTPVAEPDLVDRMRRLSVGSSTSSFSIISDAPSVQSLDTNGFVNGGVAVDPPSLQVLEICLETLTAADRTLDTSQHEVDTVEALEPIPSVKDTQQSG